MRHRYYIVRPEPNKTCVPMIALDELPPGFCLKGIPLTVTPQQINAWDMARVGADVILKDTFEVEFAQLTPSQSSTEDKNSYAEEIPATQDQTENATGESSGENDICKSSKPKISMNPEKSSNSETSNIKSNGEGLASVLKLDAEANVSQPSESYQSSAMKSLTFYRKRPTALPKRINWRSRVTTPRPRMLLLLVFMERRSFAHIGFERAIVTTCKRVADIFT